MAPGYPFNEHCSRVAAEAWSRLYEKWVSSLRSIAGVVLFFPQGKAVPWQVSVRYESSCLHETSILPDLREFGTNIDIGAVVPVRKAAGEQFDIAFCGTHDFLWELYDGLR